MKNQGFTLIEILVVIGIIAVLAAVVLIAINPARQFAQARNSQRTSNVNAILNAYGQRLADLKGVFAGTGCLDVPGAAVDEASAAEMASTGYDIRPCLVPSYIPELPVDPNMAGSLACPAPGVSCPGGYNTKYKIYKSSNGRITVLAPGTELGVLPIIQVTR